MEPVFYLENDENDFLLMDLAFRKVGCKGFVRWFRRIADLKTALTKSGLEHLPKVVLVDLKLDAEYGLDAIEWMVEQEPLKGISTLIISSGLVGREVISTLEKNATGYVFKPSGLDGWLELARQFEAIAKGDSFSPAAAAAFAQDQRAALR